MTNCDSHNRRELIRHEVGGTERNSIVLLSTKLIMLFGNKLQRRAYVHEMFSHTAPPMSHHDDRVYIT